MNNKKSIPEKTKYFKILIAGIGIVYILYLFTLQVLQAQNFRTEALRYASQSTRLPAVRGEIFDRTHTVSFATNEDSFSLAIIPAEIEKGKHEALFAKIAETAGISLDSIMKKIPPKYYHLYQAIVIANSVDTSSIIKIAENREEFPGVYWNPQPKRKYPSIGSMAHVIGYVGEITRDEYKLLYNKGYTSNDIIGKAGLEKVYDEVLKGKDGYVLKNVDVKGKDLSAYESKVEKPVNGKNLVLTIDAEIQKTAERALGQRMGSVVVLKPATGEILALVSYPWFDPNLFTANKAGDEYARLLQDEKKPLLNRAVQSSYPPASTFKTVLTAADLEEKAFPVEGKIVCKGVIDYGGREWNCWIHRPGHGPLDLKGALAQSCDVYYWTLGRDYLGIDTIVSYAKEFGYGEPTGIDLPGEASGFVPTPQWKEKTYNERWTPGDTMNLSIGQGYMLASPLQVADMMAMVANSGKIMKPHLVKEIRDPETGALLSAVQPEVLATSNISKESFLHLQEDLRGVIVNGTARTPISTKVVQIAGKTGTAEVGLKDRWHSWFASYGPYDAPVDQQIVVVTMIEATNPWEWWAPYAANVIYQAIFGGQDVDSAAKTVGVNIDRTNVRGRTE